MCLYNRFVILQLLSVMLCNFVQDFFEPEFFYWIFSKGYSASAFKMKNFELYTITFHLLNMLQ